MRSNFYGRRPLADDASSLRSGKWSWIVVLPRLVCIGAAVTGLAACSKSELEQMTSGAGATSNSAATASTMSPTTTLPVSTTTSTTAVTTPASTQPPKTTMPGAPVVPTNDQWAAILEELDLRVGAMYDDPPHAEIASACAVGSDCEFRYQAQLGDMESQKVHYEGVPPLEVVSVDRVADVAATSNGVIPAGTVYEITYMIRGGDMSNARIVDAGGNVVAELSPPAGTPEIVGSTRMLIWFPEDLELPWRFVD